MPKFKETDEFIHGADPENPELPWESFFVRSNPDIAKTFSTRVSLEYYMKLEYIRKFREERSRNQVVCDLLYAAIDKEIKKITGNKP